MKPEDQEDTTEDSDTDSGEIVDDSEDEAWADPNDPEAATGGEYHEIQREGTLTCAAHAMNNAVAAMRVTAADFERLGHGSTGPWKDEQIQEVAADGAMTAVVAPSCFAKGVTPHGVRQATWAGVLMLDGAT